MRLTELVHEALKNQLQDGDFAIDATAGNGHDTCYLSERVGEKGKVISIDIQIEAIESTRVLLSVTALTNRVNLLVGNHSVILNQLFEEYKDTIAAIVFNLGYLPGSDKCVKTKARNTIHALDAASKLLRPSGLLCVTAYRAHPGGEEETISVKEWMTSKEDIGWQINNYDPVSSNLPPILWIAYKP
ncbi:MAG: class I SAM-dependent methyltransferase [Verrucomicrobiota bacterium]|nr:class I SAM-dependent methyltransferase [Verrucomicrobiota bacterium]